MIRQLLLTLKLLFAEIKEFGQDIRLPYEDPNSRENVPWKLCHRDLVTLQQLKLVLQIKSFDIKLNS